MREYIIILCVIVLVSALFSYFTYRFFNDKLEYLMREIQMIKQQNDNLRNRNFGNTMNVKAKENVSEVPQCPVPQRGNQPVVQYSGELVEDEVESKDSSIIRAEKELEMLASELQNIEELIDESSNSAIESEYEENQSMAESIDSNNKTMSSLIDNNIVQMVNTLESRSDMSIDHPKNTMSEFDELDNIETDRNSELHDLIKKEVENSNNEMEVTDNMEISADLEINEELCNPTSSPNNVVTNETEEKEHIDNSFETDYEQLSERLKKNDLKDICKSINLPQKGNKIDLLQRICNAGRRDLVMTKIN